MFFCIYLTLSLKWIADATTCPVGQYNNGACQACDGSSRRRGTGDSCGPACHSGVKLFIVGDDCGPCPEGKFDPESSIPIPSPTPLESTVCNPCGGSTRRRNLFGADTCSPCEAGEETDETSDDCKECAPGYYKPMVGNQLCTYCFGETRRRRADSCTVCRAGGADGNDTDDCISCEDGFYALNSHCVACSGSVRRRRADDCTTCDAGTMPDPNLGTNDACIDCTDGLYGLNGVSCDFCFGETRRRSMAGKASTCEDCIGGEVPQLSTSCLATPGACTAALNTIISASSPPADLCKECTVGKFAGGIDKTCIFCRGSARRRRAAMCTKCEAGKFDHAGDYDDCLECEQGKYRNILQDHAQCYDCMGSTRRRDPSSATSCTPCALGTFSVPGQDECAECGPGHYRDSSIPQVACQVCRGFTRRRRASMCTTCNRADGLHPSHGSDDCMITTTTNTTSITNTSTSTSQLAYKRNMTSTTNVTSTRATFMYIPNTTTTTNISTFTSSTVRIGNIPRDVSRAVSRYGTLCGWAGVNLVLFYAMPSG